MTKERISFMGPLPHPLESKLRPYIVDVPDNYSGIALAEEGIYLNKDFKMGDVAANTVWFIPPSQILWVKRL